MRIFWTGLLVGGLLLTLLDVYEARKEAAAASSPSAGSLAASEDGTPWPPPDPKPTPSPKIQ